MEISVGHVNLAFPLDLLVENVNVKSHKDSLSLKLESAQIVVKFMPLFEGEIVVDEIDVKNLNANTADLIEAALIKGKVESLNVKGTSFQIEDEKAKIHDVYLSGADLNIELREAKEDTTETEPSKMIIDLEHILIDKSKVALKMNHDSLNVETGLARLSVDTTHVDLGRSVYTVANFKLDSLNLGLDMETDLNPLSISVALDNMKANKIYVDTTKVELPAFSISTADSITSLSGAASGLLDASKADVSLSGYLGLKDIKQYMEALNLPAQTLNQLRLPEQIKIDLDGNLDGSLITAEAQVEANGLIGVRGTFDLETMACNVTSDIKDLSINYGPYHLSHFNMNASYVGGNAKLDVNCHDPYLNASIKALANVGDILAMDYKHLNLKKLKANVEANIHNINLSRFNIAGIPTLKNITAKLNVANGVAKAEINSNNSLLRGKVNMEGLLATRSIQTSIVTDIAWLDLKQMGFADQRFITGLCGNMDIAYDFNQNIRVQGILSDIALDDSTGLFLPLDAEIDFCSNRDTTFAYINATSANFSLDASGSIQKILNQTTCVLDELMKQLQRKDMNQTLLKSLLPDVKIHADIDKSTPAMFLLNQMGFGFDAIETNLTCEKYEGLNGYMNLSKPYMDSITVDTISIQLESDSTKSLAHLLVQTFSNKKLRKPGFKALADVEIKQKGADIDIKLYDFKDELGIRLGAQATVDDDSLYLHLTPESPVIGYKTYHLNPENYICLHKKNKVSADIQLRADDGTGFKLYSIPNDEAWQDLSVAINHFDLTEIGKIIPFFPQITGYLEGDAHVIVNNKESMTIASDIGVRNMGYEDLHIGDVSTEFVLIPDFGTNGESTLDGTLFRDGVEVAGINGSLSTKDESQYLKATLSMQQTPLEMINGFIPDQIIALKGRGDGQLSVEGPLDKLDINGELYLDSAYLISIPYGVTLRFDNDPVRIVNSRLLLENFSVYANDNNPLVAQGYVDFSDTENMLLDLQLKAKNFEAISSKKSSKSALYGKGYVDVIATMKGSLNNLVMKGGLNVKSKTNLTYVMQDTPLNTDDQLKGLVTFEDFSDTTKAKKPEEEMLKTTSFTMDFRLKVEDGARVLCLLNSSGSNYVDIEGGGSLRMKYDNAEGLTLTGKYTVNRGEMKYSLPVIPLKTFTIKEGSYVEFAKDMMNPRLNITATENVKAVVGSEDANKRNVNFDVGIKLSQTLNNLGLQFIIDAPEDNEVSSELASMDEAQRGKIAVTMLTSGMYLSGNSTSQLSMNDALNSFLQGQITNIAGSALKTIDVSMGVQNMSNSSGSSYTDYSFSFAKRFWNNRVSVVVGGRYSTGGNTGQSSQAALDNVSLEYRLNNTASQVLKLSYVHNKRDYLEGLLDEYSGGIMLKKKLDNLLDLFKGEKKVENSKEGKDSKEGKESKER